MHHRHLEKSIEILPSWKKIGKQVHWGDLLSILSISFNFVFTERDSIDLNWKRFFVILFSNREREREMEAVLSLVLLQNSRTRERVYKLEVGIFHELKGASRPAFPSSLLHRRITIRNAPRRRFLRGARVATSVVNALTSPATSSTRKGTEIANNGPFDEALFLQPSLASQPQQQISAFFHETNVRTSAIKPKVGKVDQLKISK